MKSSQQAPEARERMRHLPACADELRALATVWAMYLDQDGAEPREMQAMRKRGVTLGVCRDQLVPIRGHLLPELAGQLQRIFDSILNPKVDGAAPPSGPAFAESDVDESDRDTPRASTADTRSRAQKQHDALATALTTLAASGALPTLGGAAPTLVVSVRAEDVAEGRGFAHISGLDEPDLPRLCPAHRLLRSRAARSSSAPTGASLRSARQSECSTTTSDGRSAFATAAASSPAAMSAPSGARSTM